MGEIIPIYGRGTNCTIDWRV